MSDLDLVERARGLVNRDRWRATAIDAIADCCVMLLLRMRWWSPIGKLVQITIETAMSPSLTGATFHGAVRAYDLDPRGVLSRLLVELDYPDGEYRHAGNLHWIVAEPYRGKRRASRLLLTSLFIARIVDAPSFVDSTERNTIGVAVCMPRGRYTSQNSERNLP